jgi:hypothetical protein
MALAIARRLGRKQRGLFDRLLIWASLAVARRSGPSGDFMRDPLVDAGVEFDPRELDAYQHGSAATTVSQP